MIPIQINEKEFLVPEGSSLLEACTLAGIHVPNMCMNQELEHFTSCMVCLVKDLMSGALLPSCSLKVVSGMKIDTDCDEIKEARKAALELLLSEHAGDCEAPCRVSCPAFMNIPQMNRLIEKGEFKQALNLVLEDIPLPGVLGRICPAPCEAACKRKPIDGAVSICLLKRFVADDSEVYPDFPTKINPTHRVAVIGAGPAGLSAAFYLQKKGIQADVYDQNPEPGGVLRYELEPDKLPVEVLEKEVEYIKKQGVKFYQNQLVDADKFSELRSRYDAVVIASGKVSEEMKTWDPIFQGKTVTIEKITYKTQMEGVFAAGSVYKPSRMAVRATAQGKELASSVYQLLHNQPVVGEKRRFNSVLGKLRTEEFEHYLMEGSSSPRQNPDKEAEGAFSPELAQQEAARCLRCDCRKPDQCKLRQLSQEYGASSKRFSYTPRKSVQKLIQAEMVVFESGKCIKCGICVRLTEQMKEEVGFTFKGRGYTVEVGLPFDQDFSKMSKETIFNLIESCPTGAISGMIHP